MKKFSQNIHYERNWLWVKKKVRFFLVFAECSDLTNSTENLWT